MPAHVYFIDRELLLLLFLLSSLVEGDGEWGLSARACHKRRTNSVLRGPHITLPSETAEKFSVNVFVWVCVQLGGTSRYNMWEESFVWQTVWRGGAVGRVGGWGLNYTFYARCMGDNRWTLEFSLYTAWGAGKFEINWINFYNYKMFFFFVISLI